MAARHFSVSRRRLASSILSVAMISGTVVALPAASNSAPASAEECSSHIATYLVEAQPGGGRPVTPPSRVIRKYIDWSPYNGNVDGRLLDTGVTAELPGTSRIFGGEAGVIYEITQDGTLRSYKDNSEAGGSLLTPLNTYGTGWNAYSKVWVRGADIFALSQVDGTVTVFVEAKNLMGKWYKKPLAEKIPASHPAAVAIASANHVWGVGNKMYTLSGGQVREWVYSTELIGFENAMAPRLADNDIVATGLSSAASAWSPAPGVMYTNSGSQDYTGIVKSYTGSPLTPANSEVGVGMYGLALPDTASCLTAPSADEKPNFGNQPAPEPIDLPQPEPEETPSTGPVTVSGRFTLGDGSPAAGMTVRIEPNDPALVGDVGAAKEIDALGTVKTAADGSWSFTLPSALPAGVQAQVDANGGVLNVAASIFGTTSSGVRMFAVDQLATVPPSSPITGQLSAFASTAAAEPAHTVALIPAAAPDADTSDPTAVQARSTYAAQYEQLPTASPEDAALTPQWQNDRGASPGPAYNPYLVNGVDVRSQAVTDESRASRASGTCYTLTKNISSAIAYTTVGEAHAYWDAKASFDYKSKMTTTVDTAIKGTGSWSITRGVTLGGSAGSSSGFANQGPYFGKHWRVPVNYVKQQNTYYCGGIARSSYQRISATGFKIPAGGYAGVFGKDVSHLDGMSRFRNSPRDRRARIAPNTYFATNKGRSAKITGAVTVMGVSLSASTQLDKDHEQKITAGGSRAADHWIWGLYAQVGTGREGVFYSY